MHCSHCGNKLIFGQLFCSKCGYRIPANQHNYRNLPLAKARAKGEIITLLLTVGITVFAAPLFIAAQLAGEEDLTWGFMGIALGLILVGIAAALFFVTLVQKQFLGNALHVEKSRYGHLKQIIADLSLRMKMREPDIFIFQDPSLNAFALGYKYPFTIALHSAIIDELDEEEEMAILAHEMGHIYFGHTRISAYTAPIGSTVPVISYLFGFWSRKAELSSDRLALYVTQNPRAVIDALIKVHAGPHVLKELDAEGVLFQEHQSRGFLSSLSQTMGDHPFMTTRIKEILRLSGELGLSYIDKNGLTVCTNCGLKVAENIVNCSRCGEGIAKADIAPAVAKAV